MIRRTLSSLTTVSMVVGATLIASVAPVSAAAAPLDMANAIVGSGIAITGASFAPLAADAAVQVRSDPVAGFPIDPGGSYAVLSTGDAALLTQPNSAGNQGTDLGASEYRTTFDTTTLKIDFNVLSGFNCLTSLKLRFLSEEFPEFVQKGYNDAAIVELDVNDWSIADQIVVAPHNIAFVGSQPISVDVTGPSQAQAAEAAGTAFDGATPILSARTPITPGPHSLFITIFDQGDAIYDSMILVDDLRASTVADPAAECPTGAYDSNVNPPNRFVPLTPDRIVDSRIGLGLTGKLPATTSTSIQVTGHGGVPTNGVAAVVLNVTVTEPSGIGFLRVTPAGGTSFVSNLNIESAGQNLANLVTVPVSTDGKIDVFSQSATHLVVDVFGYYTAASAATSGRFIAVDPTRLLDTRVANGVPGTTPVPTGGQIDVQVTGRAPVPASGVSAVVLNLTATESVGGGFVTVWPSGLPQPPTSNLNLVRANQTIPNQVVVPVGSNGKISLYTMVSTHLLLDVAGYFTDSTAPVSSIGLFIPVTPARLLDTRDATGVPTTARPGLGETVPLDVAGRGGVPLLGASAIVGNTTATESAADGYVTVYPKGIAMPNASNLNLERANQTIANHTTVRLNNGGVNLFTQRGTHLILDVSGFYSG